MKLFKDVAYDTKFPGQGNEHEDLFMQIAKTQWDVVSYNACAVKILTTHSSNDYVALRGKGVSDSYHYLLARQF